jgi:RNA polymerase sigma-70 factor (ECF subfamily)
MQAIRETEERLARMGERNLDQELVERVQSGEKAAFDILVRKYEHKLANVISRYIHDPSEVLDVAQDAFIKAYRALPNFRGDSAFYTWLYRIAINTAKNHLVAASRRPPKDDVDAQEAEQFDAGSGLKEYATPERLALRSELAQAIQDAIEALPEELRVAIVLRELEGLSYEEIASAMECPIGTVRSRIFRARDAIDKQIRPLLDETDAGE